MKTIASLLVLAIVPALASAEEMWRWTDGEGTIHYTNRRDARPADASVVKTHIVIEAAQLPDSEPDLVMRDGVVVDAAETRPAVPAREKRPHRIYTEERRRFGCYAAGMLFAGGWGHPDDITVQGNCLPYMLGLEGWLNTARAELGLREHGIDWRQVVPMYLSERRGAGEQRLTDVSDGD